MEVDERERVRDDLVASWSGLIASHETSALEMEAVAQQARDAGKRRDLSDPVYHVILSARPGESLDVEQAKLAVDAVRRSLDADKHQYFAAMHHDEDIDRYHVHLAINKVSLDGRVIDRWQDYAKLGRAAEWCEREMGLQVDRHVAWREKLGERELGLVPEMGPSLELREGVAQGMDRQEGATIDPRDAVRRTHYSWVELLQREAVRSDSRRRAGGRGLGRSARGVARLRRAVGAGRERRAGRWAGARAACQGVGSWA